MRRLHAGLFLIALVLTLPLAGCLTPDGSGFLGDLFEEPPVRMQVSDAAMPTSLEGEVQIIKGLRRGTASAEAFTAREGVARTYAWEYEGRAFTLDADLSADLYEAYRDRSRSFTLAAYGQYAVDPGDDATIQALAARLQSAAREAGVPEERTPDFVLTFIQGLAYAFDNVTTPLEDYPRYPMETLVEGGGDCEDLAFLYSALLEVLGFDSVLLVYPGHLVTGVADYGYSGAGASYEGVRYFYAEVTAKGWRIGEIPEKYQDVGPTVLPLRDVPIPDYFWVYTYNPSTETYRIDVTLYNNGTVAARDLLLTLVVETVEGTIIGSATYDGISIASGGVTVKTYWLTASTPSGVWVRLRGVLEGESLPAVETASAWALR